MHFVDNREARQTKAIAASGADWRQRQRWECGARAMLNSLDLHCEPTPAAPDFLEGIARRSDDEAKAGQ
eukprot:8340482-Pyramimonas_sp.AAC.1